MYGNGCAGSTASGVSTGNTFSRNIAASRSRSSSSRLRPTAAPRCPSARSAGRTSSWKTAELAQHQLVAARPDAIEHLARHQAAGGRDRDAGRDPPLEAGDAHHEELVEVAREDRQEPGALEQRQLAVLGELEDALVEGEPGQLAVQEPVVGQRLLDARQDGGGVVGRGSYLRDLGVLAHAHRLRIARPGGSRSAFNTCCLSEVEPVETTRRPLWVVGPVDAHRGAATRRSSLSRPVRSRTAPPPEAPAPLVVSTSSTTGLGTQRRPSGRACRGPGRRSSLSRPVTSRRSSLSRPVTSRRSSVSRPATPRCAGEPRQRAVRFSIAGLAHPVAGSVQDVGVEGSPAIDD